MSWMTEDGLPADRPASTPVVYTQIEEAYCAEDPRRWRWVAALVLIEVIGWPREYVAHALRTDVTKVSRMVRRASRDLKKRLKADDAQRPRNDQ